MKRTLTLTRDCEHTCIHFPIRFAQTEHQLTDMLVIDHVLCNVVPVLMSFLSKFDI